MQVSTTIPAFALYVVARLAQMPLLLLCLRRLWFRKVHGRQHLSRTRFSRAGDGIIEQGNKMLCRLRAAVRGAIFGMSTIAFLGSGNMAYAIASGIVRSGILPAQDVFAADISAAQLERFTKLGCRTGGAAELAKKCDVIFLSVKPQNFPQLLPEIADSVSEDKVIVTIAAGISISYIKQQLGKNPAIIRALPNVPMLVGRGATMLSYEAPVTNEQFGFVRSIFDSCGTTAVIDESLMNESVFLHSSSPAAIFRFADTVAVHAQNRGIDAATAAAMFAQTLRGCADMIEQSGKTCGELAAMVTSPGGTTLAALNVLDDGDFYGSLDRAMEACKKRADELGK